MESHNSEIFYTLSVNFITNIQNDSADLKTPTCGSKYYVFLRNKCLCNDNGTVVTG